MVKFIARAGGSAGRIIALATVATVLTACGGSSGDTALEEQDLDDDGVINSEDPDADGDGVADLTVGSVDYDEDGVPDNLLLGAQDFDEDGVLNSLDADADNDGLEDLVDDPFVDLDSDGIDDFSGLTEEEALAGTTMPVDGDNDGDGFVDVTNATPCGGESGDDNSSLNANWDDNCTVKRSAVNGQFADSLYSAGIQRVVYCSGFGNGATYANFADGEFGPGTETALKDFQLSTPDPQTDDGVVGPATWAKLQSRVELLAAGTFQDNGDGTTSGQDAYGFSEGRCAGITLFYQTTTPGADGISIVEGGWSLARNQPNENVAIPFSIDAPFNRL